MENKKIPMLPFHKTKRLDTIKKKARELSILCNIDVSLIGSHHSQPNRWHTWPEDPKELDRVIKKYQKKVEEKEPQKELGKGAILEFDVDKTLEGMSDEQLRTNLDGTNEIANDVDQKLYALLSKHNSGTDTAPMVIDLPLYQTVDEANNIEFDCEGTHTTPMIFDSLVNPPKKDAANCDELDYGVAFKGPKIFGVFLTPGMEGRSSSGSAQSTETEI